MAPLIAEYDRHINDMGSQLKKYQVNDEILQQVHTDVVLIFYQRWMVINMLLHGGRFHIHSRFFDSLIFLSLITSLVKSVNTVHILC